MSVKRIVSSSPWKSSSGMSVAFYTDLLSTHSHKPNFMPPTHPPTHPPPLKNKHKTVSQTVRECSTVIRHCSTVAAFQWTQLVCHQDSSGSIPASTHTQALKDTYNHSTQINTDSNIFNFKFEKMNSTWRMQKKQTSSSLNCVLLQITSVSSKLQLSQALRSSWRVHTKSTRTRSFHQSFGSQLAVVTANTTSNISAIFLLQSKKSAKALPRLPCRPLTSRCEHLGVSVWCNISSGAAPRAGEV